MASQESLNQHAIYQTLGVGRQIVVEIVKNFTPLGHFLGIDSHH
jgi:hypothetical protein